MENTPLELYEKAYKLHYEERRISEAIVYYKKLIDMFPESNECGYAVIQLQKIKANEVANSIKDILEESKRSVNILPFFVFSLILFLLYMGSFLFIVKSFSEKIKLEQKRTHLVFSVLGKLVRKDYTGVQELLSELKKISPDNITPYELSAYVYRLQKKEDESINEYTTYFALNPDKKPSENELKYLRKKEQPLPDKSNNIKNQTTIDSSSKVSKSEIENNENISSSPTNKKQSPTVRSKPQTQPSPTPPPSPEKEKKKKGLLLVDPDSISYF